MYLGFLNQKVFSRISMRKRDMRLISDGYLNIVIMLMLNLVNLVERLINNINKSILEIYKLIWIRMLEVKRKTYNKYEMRQLHLSVQILRLKMEL